MLGLSLALSVYDIAIANGLRPRHPVCVAVGAFAGGALAAFGILVLVKPLKSLPPSHFSLQLVQPWTDETMPRSEIVIHGISTAKLVDGAVLEAAIEWNDHYLALVTDDIPNEDTLRLYLFDSTLNLVDSATLGAMYSTGSFDLLELLPPNVVRFAFVGDTMWDIELLERPELTIPLISDPKGVSRPLSLYRRFRIHGQPKPELRP